jgi:hypothetical protein
MNRTAIVGVVLALLGVAALAYQGVTYTSHDAVVDIGPLHATADHQKTIPIPPVLGGVAVVGGLVLLVAGMRRPA